MSPLPFDKLDVEDVISKLATSEKVALLTGLDMVRNIDVAQLGLARYLLQFSSSALR